MPTKDLTIPTDFHHKSAHLKKLFSPFYQGNLDTFASQETGYRMRAEFRIWHQDGQAHYSMFEPGNKKPYIISTFEPGSTTIQKLMPSILIVVNHDTTLSTKLFQIEILTSSLGQALVTLIYHKPLLEPWLHAAQKMSAELGCQIIGRSRKQKVTLETDYIYEEFTIAEKTYRYQHVEASFTQPNAAICQQMLNWAYQCILPRESGDLLELYCGNGNFTLPLANLFHRVLATEISKSSIYSAQHNCSINEIDNIDFVRLSSEELSQALNGERQFRRLQHLDLKQYHFSHVFVDPPRAGLDDKTRELIADFDNIIYISCNPNTLVRDLEYLNVTHDVVKMAFFDQFPGTPHCECGAVLKRKGADSRLKSFPD